MKQVPNKIFDLEERTAKFGERVIILCQSLELSVISRSLVSQFVRFATSVGANYMEANSASSKKDFTNKIFIAKKEAQESKHWIRMLMVCYKNRREEFEKLWQEAHELTLIFQKITNSLRNKN